LPDANHSHALSRRERAPAAAGGHAIGIATALWAGSIFLSRVIGLVREQVIGRTLGASREADLYFASFTLPDFLNYLLAAGALSIVFIPIFQAHLTRDDERGAWRAFSVIANAIVLLGAAGIAVLMFYGRPLALLVAPGFSEPAEIDTLVRLTRIILPAQLFHIVGGLLSAALQARNKHALPALAPLVYSAGIIAGGLIGAASPTLGADGFAWGVLAGSFLGPFALPLYGCARSGLKWSLAISPRDADLRRYLRLSLPIMIGFSIVAVDEWIVKNQASYLAPGTLSYLQYGRTLMKVPIGMFGMAAGVAAYPTISRLVSGGDAVEAYAVLARSVRLLLLLIFGAQICLTTAGFEAAYLIWGLFAHRFSAADAQETAAALAVLSLGLGGWATQTVISRGFYALGNTWLPTLVGTAVAFAAVPLYVVLRLAYGATGLALASSIAITVYVLLLGFLQRRRFEREAVRAGTALAGPGIAATALRLAIAAAIATAVGLGARQLALVALPGLELPVVIARATLICATGVASYLLLAWLAGVSDLHDVFDLVTHRLRRQRLPSAPGN